MNLDELRSVRRTERQKDSLQHLRDSFYEDVAAFIAERKAERRRAADAADDPFGDPDVGRLTDEIETAEDVVESIYERRVGKIVKLASFAAADMSADTNGLTAEEQVLFDGLVSRIKQNRQTVLDVLAGEGGGSSASEQTETGDEGSASGDPAGDTTPTPEITPDTPSDEKDTPSDENPTVTDTPPTDGEPTTPPADDVLAEAMGGNDGAAPSTDSSASPETPPDVPPDAPPDAAPPETPVIGGDDTTEQAGNADDTERVTLRITEDIGQIFGVDEREYDLESEDVVTLPSTNAGPLLDRNAAERLD